MARSPSSSSGTDAVRHSLDSHAVDAESEDRPYLISMLQRLGYTDAQIQDYLAGREMPAQPTAHATNHAPSAKAAKPTHARTEPDHGEQRDVEVEYTGPGLQDYRIVDPVDFFGDQNLVEFEQAPAAGEWEDTGSETATLGEGTDGQSGELNEFQPATEEDIARAASEGWNEADAADADAKEQAELAEIARRQGLAWDDTQAQAADQTIHYGDYTLYQKDDLRDGQPARVFAFSRQPPGEGYEPATQLPEGYQVAENPETGRPFLRRIGDEGQSGDVLQGTAGPDSGDPNRRRVRLKRVRAANREEAMRLVEREGGSPLASVPIDIEKRLGDE